MPFEYAFRRASVTQCEVCFMSVFKRTQSYMSTKVCARVRVHVHAVQSRAQRQSGCPTGVSTYSVSKPIWACWQAGAWLPISLTSCPMSALLCRDAAERKRSWDCPTRGAVEEAIGETKQGAREGGCMPGRGMTWGGKLMEYKWDGAVAMKERQEVWRCASGQLLVINIQRVVPNWAFAGFT